jgi:uncharacterized protein (TIGR02001 family)
MRQLILASAVAAAAAAPAAVYAQAPAAPAAPASPHTFSYNLGFFSNYIFRGISQTGGKPALQGGVDYSHASGFYAGTWASNVSWLEDSAPPIYNRSSMEWDFYGGYKWAFANDFGLDVGTIYYWYPGERNPGVSTANTWEIYVAGTWKFLGAKFSYNLEDYFGAKNYTGTGLKADGTWYLDLFANYAFGDSGFALNAHYGILDVKNDGVGAAEASYNDWRIGGTYTVPSGPVKGLEIGAYYSDTDAKSPSVYYVDRTGYDTAKGVLVAYVKKTF